MGDEFIISSAATAEVEGRNCGKWGKYCLAQLFKGAAVLQSSLEGTSQEVMEVIIIWNEEGKQ